MGISYLTIDGNEAAAHVAFRVSEVIAIYPITPSSPMGELADAWAAADATNIWGTVPLVVEMQSEGGAAGAVHGALQAGALTTTFTASQGLLLMVPNMFKIAGELTSAVFHVAARSVAAQALSIFADHSDVMATRGTGFALLCSNNPQEAMDFALVATAATLASRVPFIHFFDGFRTSHEVRKLKPLSDDDIRALIEDAHVHNHRQRGLTPERPVVRGTAQNPDVFFQARETVNPYYIAAPALVQQAFDALETKVGRAYKLFDYVGAPDATRVVVMMGSGADTAHEAVEHLNAQGEKVGLVKVRLYRPFDGAALVAALPKTVEAIAVLDRTKEPGSAGEPLYKDAVTALVEANSGNGGRMPRVIGGRYGLSSKEFTPAMVKAVLDELSKDAPKNHFTVGIDDDVTHTSLEVDANFRTESSDVVRAMFFGLGADGTVGANKNSIKLIGEGTDNHAQGYFVYDSKKSGSITISHLRFGPREIRSTYLIQSANFVGCHHTLFLDRFDVLEAAEPGAVFLLNSPHGPNDVWASLPRIVQQHIVDKQLKFYVIDATSVAQDVGMGRRINTIMQTCFFAISGVLPRDEAIAKIKESIQKTYGKRGQAVVDQNYKAVDAALESMHQVAVPGAVSSAIELRQVVPDHAPEFVKNVTSRIIARDGDRLPVSAMPDDGTYPTGTTRWEKRNITDEIPVWDEEICIQCGKCVLVCPHAVVRAKLFDRQLLEGAPSTFKHADSRFKAFPKDQNVYTLQIAPEDCTGCKLCVEVCPVKNKQEPGLLAINMQPQAPLLETERANWDFFLELPNVRRQQVSLNQVKDVQLIEPLFEFSGACSGCGETPYLKLLSQLFGDRAVIANATGCSSIYGGNLPTTPWAQDRHGRGPAWSNSLFEDNAEFGLGFRLTFDKQREYARELVARLRAELDPALADGLFADIPPNDEAIDAQRERVAELKAALEPKAATSPDARNLLSVADLLVPRSVWIVGGDGWAYDIGYGGLDHVLASGRNVNVLVLDTEVYSNTGGQMSKATPRGAVAKFAAGGKPLPKKDLGRLAISYGNIYVAQIAFGASDMQTVRALLEAERYDGPSLIIAYSTCIAHGFDLVDGLSQQKLASKTGYWPLYRYDPTKLGTGENPLSIDSKAPAAPLEEFAYNETRYNMLTRSKPDVAKALLEEAQADVHERWQSLTALAETFAKKNGGDVKSG